jgi:lipopolysaccharide/colanic/teichoic acid biosynthesis glycosyltransferase
MQSRTIWGLDISRLHEQFWAAHGVQIVRTDEPPSINLSARAYLLLDSALMVLFHPGEIFDRSNRLTADLIYLRLHDAREQSFRERAVTDDTDRFIRFERHYEGGPFSKVARVPMTPDPRLAALWQMAPEPAQAAYAFRQIAPRRCRSVASINGRLYESENDVQAQFTADLLRLWPQPHQVLERARNVASNVWADPDSEVSPAARIVGPAWIGAGRRVEASTVVVGPVVLWDEPHMRPVPHRAKLQTSPIRYSAPLTVPAQAGAQPAAKSYRFKRAFDIFASAMALMLTLPLYPFIILAIWIEDGRPIFFAHRRETLGGRKFPCLKFRSMQKNAEKAKKGLQAENGTDGPQFFMPVDPRVTRVGDFLRKRQLDELPQFFNVLLGHMSLVGPRPSPYAENQFCPPWREARLSVRPGITGLWQIERKRLTNGGFQEWIKYDIEYVQNASFMLDLRILFRTALMFVRRQAD